MKKLILTMAIIFAAMVSNAQNFQFLYGYGNGEPVNFITLEIYKPLDGGDFYYFTDFKLNFGGYFESYTEVSKYWKIGKNGYSVTTQYNMGTFVDDDLAYRINPVYLGGIQKAVEIDGWIFTFDLLYRYDDYTSQSGVQVTYIYLKEWGNWTLSGYLDVWNSGVYDPEQTATVAVFEPQLFYSFTKRWSVGVEARVSNYTLALPYKDYIMGGLKWNLEN